MTVKERIERLKHLDPEMPIACLVWQPADVEERMTQRGLPKQKQSFYSHWPQ